SGGNMHFQYLRYADVMLTYAEEKIMQSDVDELANDCSDQVRQRAGRDMTVADVKTGNKTQQVWIALLQYERRTGFAGEGLRYDDILRWKIAEDVLNQPALGHSRLVNGRMETLKIEDRAFKSINYLWPFHESSLRVEPGLIQNPGY